MKKWLGFLIVLSWPLASGCHLVLPTEDKPAALLHVVTWGTNRADSGYAIAVDPAGSVYVAGPTAASMDGHPYLGLQDVFLTQLSSRGQFIGTIQFGTDSTERPTAIAVGGGGDVYVVGITTGTMPQNTFKGGVDGFAAKIRVNGSVAWIRQFGTTGDDLFLNLALDSSDNLYIVGNTAGALNGQTRIGAEDAVLLKLDKDGNLLWTKQFGTTGVDAASGVAVNSRNQVYVVGAVTGPFEGNSQIGNGDMFLANFSTSGVLVFAKQYGTTYSDQLFSVTVAGDFIYACGQVGAAFQGNVHNGDFDAVVVRFDSRGNLGWARQFGSTGEDMATGLVVNDDLRLHVVGFVSGGLPGQAPGGGRDAFVMKMDISGVTIWTRQFGSTGDEVANAIAEDMDGRIFVTGGFTGQFEGQSTQGETDIFLLFSE